MTIEDQPDISDSFLYSLSSYEGLNWFQNIVLFSCKDDPYVPESSARIQMPAEAFN